MPDIMNTLNSTRPKRSSTKRPASQISGDGVCSPTKYRKVCLLTPKPPRRPNHGVRRRPWTTWRVPVAFAVPESEALDSCLNDLVASMERLHLTPTPSIEKLPSEILLKIFEYLAPTPVTPQGRTRLATLKRPDLPPHWTRYLDGRQDIKSLCLVSQKTRLVATPLLYRSILIWQLRQLHTLARTFSVAPRLALNTRHINCAVDFDRVDTAPTFHHSSPWRFPTHWMGNKVRASHPYRRFNTWFAQSEAGSNPLFARNNRAGEALLCAILCVTNRVETLNLILHRQSELLRPRPSLWNWLFDTTDSLFQVNMVIPTGLTAAAPTKEQLLECPHWPPPFLRNLTVECSSRGMTGSLIQFDIVPYADVLRHQDLLRYHRWSRLDPFDLLRSRRHDLFHPSDIVHLTGYLDGLQRIPHIADSSPAITTHLDSLKQLDTYFSSPDYDYVSAQSLTEILTMLRVPWTYDSPLLTRSKMVSKALRLFFNYDFPRISGPTGISSLTLTHQIGDENPCVPEIPGTTLPCFQNRLLTPPFCPDFIPNLVDLDLSIRMEQHATRLAYIIRGRLKLGDTELGSYLPRLQTLRLTTEAWLGSLVSLHHVLGGERFWYPGGGANPPDPRNLMNIATDFAAPSAAAANDLSTTTSSLLSPSSTASPATTPTSPPTRHLEALVSELPPGLKELHLIEWWWPFSSPAANMPARYDAAAAAGETQEEETWPERYARVQGALVAGLGELAGVLGRLRPSVKKVTVEVNSWTSYPGNYDVRGGTREGTSERERREAGRVWVEWAKVKGTGLKGLKRRFRERGVEFKVVLAKGDLDGM
ncbi:hypothetical protein QBC39DRAFT_402770 [Podospora conica]|nr:hypothetical protein QBC39DRAFT_402770 [Schizothecium conicum]